MRAGRLALLASAAAAALFASPALAAPADDSAALEQRFDALISPADQQQWLQQMSSAPNHVGAPHNKANAEMQLALFKQWGWDARLEQFDVLFPTPKERVLEMTEPTRYPAKIAEPAVSIDQTSNPEERAIAGV